VAQLFEQVRTDWNQCFALEGMLLQPLRWRCVDCVIHHERDEREEQQYIYVARTSNITHVEQSQNTGKLLYQMSLFTLKAFSINGKAYCLSHSYS